MTRKTFAVDIDGTITENGLGRINLDALSALRHINKIGHNVIFVSGRSSVEAYLLSIFAGTNHIAVGENGGCITYGPDSHILLGNKQECIDALQIIQSKIKNVKEKQVFPRKTEVVLERSFNIDEARKVIHENNQHVSLTDSLYAFHINSLGIDKARGFKEVMKMLSVSKENIISIGDSETDLPLFEVSDISIALGNSSDFVKSKASMTVTSMAGDGVIEALEKLAPKLTTR